MSYSLVQQNAVEYLGDPVGYLSTPTTGNLLIVTFQSNQSGGRDITDSSGAWTQHPLSPFNFGTSQSVNFFYKLASVSQSNSLDVAAGVNHTPISLYEFSGAPASLTGIIDTSDAQKGNSFMSDVPPSGPTPSITTTNAKDLVFSALSWGNGTVTSPSFDTLTTLEFNSTSFNFAQIDGYSVVSATGTYAPICSWSNNNRIWGSILTSFKAGAASSYPVGLPLMGMG